MSSLNKVILIGRLVKDPDLRYTPNGKPVTSLRLAVDRNRSGPGGERETDFIDVVVWQQAAEFAAKYASKGRLVAIDGRLQVRTYETAEKQKRTVYEVVANEFRLLDRKESGGGGSFDAGGGGYDAPVRETVYSGGGNAPSPAPDRGGYEHNGGFEDDIPF
jgi:single-strand DNA-binding protein